jgi:hypothetical protein
MSSRCWATRAESVGLIQRRRLSQQQIAVDTRNNGVEFWIERIDARQMRRHHFPARHVTPPDRRREIDGRHGEDVAPLFRPVCLSAHSLSNDRCRR